jgi:hypothetical protein
MSCIKIGEIRSFNLVKKQINSSLREIKSILSAKIKFRIYQEIKEYELRDLHTSL